MARCAGCSSFSVSHSDTNCIHLTGDGTSGDHLIAALQISPDAGNELVCRANGLYAPTGGGGGGQKTVITVGTPGIVAFGGQAATPAALFATADYQGNGVNDSVAIQAAIDFAAALAGTLQNVVVEILPGIYVVNTPLDTKGVWIQGTGDHGTTAFYTATFLGAAANTRTINTTMPVNLRWIGIQNSTGGSAAIKCQLLNQLEECDIAGDVNGADQGVIECEGFGYISHSTIACTTTGQNNLAVTGSVTASGYTRSWLINSSITNSNVIFTGVNGTPTDIYISGNRFVSANFTMTGAGKNFSDFNINNNVFENCTITLKGDGSYNNSFTNNTLNNGQMIIASENPGVTNVFQWRVIGNQIQTQNTVNALNVSDCNYSTISDNYIYIPFFHGIVLTNCLKVTVVGNNLRDYGAGAANTYDGIRIVTSNEIMVQANKVFSTTGKYGINVVSGNDNLVTNNDLKSSGLTASFNDTATGTITVAGNRL